MEVNGRLWNPLDTRREGPQSRFERYGEEKILTPARSPSLYRLSYAAST
jgi:hypothetical protein